MAAYFFDSSAIVKRYVSEAGSAWVRSITDPLTANRIYLAALQPLKWFRLLCVANAAAVSQRRTLL